MNVSQAIHYDLIDPQPKLRLAQVQTVEQFQRFAPEILKLLQQYQLVLLDDFCDPNPMQLVHNLGTYLPWLWLLVETGGNHAQPSNNQTAERVYGLAGLSDVIPGRHAFVHGVSHPGIRRHPAIRELGQHVLNVAFQELKVRKVKAEIEANNASAKGYCQRMGFVREAHFRQDNRIAGQWQDVLVYSLFAEQFEAKKVCPAPY